MHDLRTESDPPTTLPAALRAPVRGVPCPLTSLWQEAAQALDARRSREAARVKVATPPMVQTAQERRRERTRYRFD